MFMCLLLQSGRAMIFLQFLACLGNLPNIWIPATGSQVYGTCCFEKGN